MSLAGKGAVAIWHDIAPKGRVAFYSWHGQEHMPERAMDHADGSAFPRRGALTLRGGGKLRRRPGRPHRHHSLCRR